MKTLFFRLFCGAAALALAGGCSRNAIYIDQGGGSDASTGSGPSGTSLVTFQAAVESRNLTRAMAPVRKDVRAAIYAYPGAATDASGAPVAQGDYLSATPGLLQGVNGFRMYLPSGVYNFYAVSDNTQFAPPSFSDGVSEELINGIDYLWWGGAMHDITSTQAGIPIVFQHCATQVIFEVEAGPGIALNSLVLVHLYPPVEGARIDLATGVIPPADTYAERESKMTVTGLTAQYTMLPVSGAGPLRVSFDVLLNGETTPRTYATEVDLTDGQFVAGDSYRFRAVITGSEVAFPEVSVRSWTDVDQTGTPLYPDQM